MRSNNFDRIAFVYDGLASIIFAGAIKKAQCCFLEKIPAGARVLVIGSGTGWIASEMLRVNSNARITLVDASQKMSELARKRLKDQPVTILCSDETQKFNEPFDVIVLPFYLDMFPDKKVKSVIGLIQKNTHSKTLWLVTDFVSETW